MSDNPPMVGVPPEFVALRGLRVFWFNGTGFTGLPDLLKHWTQLVDLRFANNKQIHEISRIASSYVFHAHSCSGDRLPHASGAAGGLRLLDHACST